MLNPTLPILESPVKDLLVDKEELRRIEGGDSHKNIDDWLARRISDILTDTYYKFSGILQSESKKQRCSLIITLLRA